ncbi:MAG: ABC-F family ATP-binding cassette domain-containing protein, partial [Oscillospiraceae bacterium]|nr:ABC-F family ATP-binding cassette domain-containing protein [Oscillospiraceae bacterium]
MLVTLSDVGKSFGAERIFEHINVNINDNDRIALIGPNGAGKTTLLNLIASGEADEGEIGRCEDIRIGYLRQNGGLQSGATIDEEMRRALGEVFKTEQLMRETGEKMASVDSSGAQYKALEDEYHRLEAKFASLDGYGADVRINT